MNVEIITIVVCFLLIQSVISLGVLRKRKKYKATTEILGDRIVALCDSILQLTLDVPKDQGKELIEETEVLNSCIRQFVKLIYEDDYFDKDIEKVLAIGPQPKFLEVELNEEKIQKAKKNFGWNDKDIEDWLFVRLCTYQHWNHILTYKNHYQAWK